MKRKLILSSILSLCSFFISGQTELDNLECIIKKDGVYYAELDEETNIYIRFYDKDTVVTTSSTNNLKMACTYINKEMGEKMLFGKYFTNDDACNVRVKAKNDFGKVKMDGIISGNKLVLSVINMDNKTASDFIFNFYPLPSL